MIKFDNEEKIYSTVWPYVHRKLSTTIFNLLEHMTQLGLSQRLRDIGTNVHL